MKLRKKLFSKKLSKKQKIVCVLLLCSVIIALCYAGIQSVSASVVIETGKKQDSGRGWTYTFENNMLIMEYTYHYVSQATLSYETTGTIWTKEKSGGYPDEIDENRREYAITAVKQDIMPTGKDVYKYDSVGDGKSYSKITYPAEAIIDLIKTVYEIEELEPSPTEYQVYLSEVYCLKERNSPSDEWVVKYNKKYKNIEAIRGAAQWTQSTHDGFEQYYDVPITFKLAGATLDIVYVDVEGNKLKGPEEAAKVAVGNTKSISYDASDIIEGGKTYTYKGIQLVHEDDSVSDSWKSNTGDYTFHPTKEGKYTLYVGFEAAHEHDWLIQYDPDGHWYECSTCKETTEKHEHNMVEESSSDGDVVFVCECPDHPECEYSYMVHEHDWTPKHDPRNHWYECSNENCNETTEKHAHQMVETDKTDDKGDIIRECECPDHPDCDYTDTLHVCTFVWGDNDAETHWYVCEECGKKSEPHPHVMVKTDEVDEKGNVIRTCECSEHLECEFTDAIHVHEYVEWAPDYRDQDYYYPEDGYEEQGYVYDPDIYHWRYCAYNSCTATSGRTKHKPGEYVSEGEGYSVQRCTECNWILDRKNVTVSLRIHPNGGTFPDGSTDAVLLTDSLEYDAVSDLGKLGTEYWVIFEEGYSFAGFYIVEPGNSECFYYPNHETQTCLADTKFFYPLNNGKYLSGVKKDYILYAQKSAAEYTVRYNANGGTGIMYDRTYKVGVEFTLSPNGFQYLNNITYNPGDVSCVVETTLDNTKVWSDFTGWGTNSNGPVVYADKQKVIDLKKGAGIVNLYAIWNHGTIILPNAIATDGGSKLSGWITEDGTFISVLNESGNFKAVLYPLKGGDETFTAVWVPNEYTVSFDSAGGTACDPINVAYKKSYNYNNAGLPTTMKTGYTFLGWVYKPTMEAITNSSIVLYPFDHTLTALWKVNDVTVYLDYTFHFEQTAQNPSKNSAGFPLLTSVTNEIDKMVLEYDSYYGTLPKPTMDGYTFAGWYMEKDAFGNGCGHQDCLLTETGSRVTTMNTHTLYARWVKEQYRVDLDYNYDYSVWED